MQDAPASKKAYNNKILLPVLDNNNREISLQMV